MCATARMGCGVTVDPSRSSTPSLRLARGMPAASTRARNGANATSALVPKYTASSSAPRSSAASTLRGPSTTNARSAARARASRTSSRSRRTDGWRGPSSWTSRGRTSGSVEGLSGRGDERAERGVVTNREVGEDLAVDVDLGGLQPRDETRVADVVLTARGVDAHDPELPELTLAGAPVAVRVVAGV